MVARERHPLNDKDKRLGQISHHSLKVHRRQCARDASIKSVTFAKKNPYSLHYQRCPSPCKVSYFWRLIPLHAHELATFFPPRTLPVCIIRPSVPNTCTVARSTENMEGRAIPKRSHYHRPREYVGRLI